MRKLINAVNPIPLLLIVALLLLGASLSNYGRQALAQGANAPCSPSFQLCGQRIPYTAGSGIAIDTNNVVSTVGITETCSVAPTGLTIVNGVITAKTGGTCTP